MASLRVVMMGTGTFAEPTFQALLASGKHPVVGLVTQPDRPIGQERGSTRQTGQGMKTIAVQQGIPVFQPDSINTPEGIAALQEMRPDLLVVAAYGQILAREVLEAAPHGGINVHASLLPKYRGAAPVAWAIYHGETATGVTIIRMSTALDAGDMLAQEVLAIHPHETAGELEARLAPLGAKLALEVIDQLASGTTRGVKQDLTQVTKAPKLKKPNGLIDWSRTAEQVCCQIRAMQPWPTPFTFFHHKGKPPVRIIITRAAPFASPSGASPAISGHVLAELASSSRLVVAAGQGTAVEVQELQPAGKRRMATVEFLRGHALADGDFLGPETS